MSKAVLISINPKWCELIARGEKTVEVRKTRPKLETPFKCYIYRTKGKVRHLIGGKWVDMLVGGTIIGEFVCDNIQEIGFTPYNHGEYICKEDTYIEQSCIPFNEMFDYLRDGYGYGWHISDLVIYDKPQELNWFVVEGDCDCMNCKKCSWFNKGNGYNVEDDCDLGYENIYRKKTLKPLFRPPQSWCYVEDLEGAD